MMGGVVCIAYNPKPSLLENLMPHKIFTFKPEKPEGYYYGKTGDWKDYWRDLFAKRKARRAERKAERQLARAERRAVLTDGQPNFAPAAAPMVPAKIDLGWDPAPSPIIDLTVSPNPFDNQLAISINLTENTVLDFQLIDVNGKLLFSWEAQTLGGSQSLTLDLSGDALPGGTYFLRVVGGNQLLKTVTLVK